MNIHQPTVFLETEQKALEINLDERIYGAFAEIGAGQEVVRWFFRVGAAAGTVAKSISAYDMMVSDAIYGCGDRYVSRTRLQAMLDHEFELNIERLGEKRGDTTAFFAFADTVVVMYEGQIVQIGSPSELFERPKHTFVGYFIGSPGMNVMSVTLDGKAATFGSTRIELPGGAAVGAGTKTELGIRPEYVKLGRQGMPVTISKIEDIGRHRIVRAALEGQELAMIVPEHGEIPAEPRISFDPKGINIYADSWRLELEA